MTLSPDEQVLLAERTNIHEFDGCLSEAEAQEKTLAYVLSLRGAQAEMFAA